MMMLCVAGAVRCHLLSVILGCLFWSLRLSCCVLFVACCLCCAVVLIVLLRVAFCSVFVFCWLLLLVGGVVC